MFSLDIEFTKSWDEMEFLYIFSEFYYKPHKKTTEVGQNI